MEGGGVLGLREGAGGFRKFKYGGDLGGNNQSLSPFLTYSSWWCGGDLILIWLLKTRWEGGGCFKRA